MINPSRPEPGATSIPGANLAPGSAHLRSPLAAVPRRRRGPCALKAAFAFTVVLEPERYAGYYGCELTRVRSDAIETLQWSVADLPGLCNLGAGLRWHAPGGKSLTPDRRVRVPRLPTLRIYYDLTVEVDRDAYARWAQVPRCQVRTDLAAYMTSEIPALCCLNGYGAKVRWHHPAAPVPTGGRSWPTERESEGYVPDPDARIPEVDEDRDVEWA